MVSLMMLLTKERNTPYQMVNIHNREQLFDSAYFPLSSDIKFVLLVNLIVIGQPVFEDLKERIN
jgi:hypothetical protein